MKPIWHFVGLLLLLMGAIILSSGIYQWIRPPAHPTVLANLHSGIWWGAIMVIAGLIFRVTSLKHKAG